MSPQQEVEYNLESIFSPLLDSLRNSWNIETATNILLSLIFYKRLYSLQKEGIDIPVDMGGGDLLQRIQTQLLSDKRQALIDLRLGLLEIERKNPPLAGVFSPLAEALSSEQNIQPLVQVILSLEDLDFSSERFPRAIFGNFFYNTLYSSALHAGRVGEQWISPPSINKLLAGLACAQEGERLYAPAAGLAGSILALHTRSPKLQIYAEELRVNTWVWAKMNLFMQGIYDAELRCCDSLRQVAESPPKVDIALAHFPFGMSIKTEEVLYEPYLNMPLELRSTPELEGNSLFIQRMLHQLSEEGRALCVLPLRSLYKDRQERRLREYLIARDWLEAVISLPHGLLYAGNSPICLLIINKKKSAERQERVLFVNGAILEVESRAKSYRSLSDEQIEKLIDAYKGFGRAGSIAPELYDCIDLVPNSRIIEQQYNLNARRYASPVLQELRRLDQIQPLSTLGEVFRKEMPSVWVSAESLPERSLPFVQAKDLSLSFAEYQLDIEKLGTLAEEAPEVEGRLLTESVLLINRAGRDFRLGYFAYQGQALAVHEDIMIFSLDEEKVLVEYLFLQLHSKLFQQQVLTYKTDYEYPLLIEKEFMQLHIFLPSKEEQEKITRDTKIELLRQEERKVEQLRYRLNIGKQQAQSEQYKIISSLQHELGNRLPAVLSDVKDLRDYLQEKAENGQALRMEEPLFADFEDFEEEEEAGDSLATVMQRVESMLRYAISTIDAAGHIIKADRNRLQLEYVPMRSFFEEIQALYAHEKRFRIEVELEQDEQGKELPLGTCLDKAQMTTAVVNLIENALRHGFLDDRQYLIRFRVQQSTDKNELIIEYKNDGKPFPENFSFQDFISYGNYAGQYGHSGIGGYLIHQIINNHDGHLYHIDNIERNDPFKLQFEISLPLRSC